jgi:hypothetical protein
MLTDPSWDDITPLILENLNAVDLETFNGLDEYIDALLFYVAHMYPALGLLEQTSTNFGSPKHGENQPIQKHGENTGTVLEDFRFQNIVLRLEGRGFSRVTAEQIQKCLSALVMSMEGGKVVKVRFWGSIKREARTYFIAAALHATGEWVYWYSSELEPHGWCELPLAGKEGGIESELAEKVREKTEEMEEGRIFFTIAVL